MSDTWSTTLIVAVVAVLLIAGRLISGRFDRERIRQQVESHGGKILDISWNPFPRGWLAQRTARQYDVRYRTHRGAIVSAVCATNLWSGVYWIRNLPPGFEEPGERAQAASAESPSAEDIAQSQAAPAEPVLCLRCGAKIPARATHCAKCGWSYEG